MPLARPKTDPSLNSGQQVEAGLLFVSVLVSKPEGFFEVNFDHGQALGRHGWTGFGAVFESEEAIDVRGSQFSPAYVQERAYNFANHVTQERAAVDGEDQFVVVRAAQQFGGIDFTLHGTVFIFFFGTRRSRKRRKIVDTHETHRRIAHGVFVERERIMQDIAVQHGRDNFSAVDAIAIDFAVRGPARVELRAGFFGLQDADGRRKMAFSAR